MILSKEIIRALFVAFGCIEILTNCNYLLRHNGMSFARKQHGELPQDISDNKIKIKVICMLVAGFVFFFSGLVSYLSHTYISMIFIISSMLFAVYAIVEACYYRYWKTIGFSIVSMILFIIVCIVSL